MNWFGIQWVMPSTVKEALYKWAFRRSKRRRRAWDVTTNSYVGNMEQRNRRAFERVEKDFVHVRSSLVGLVSFWCTHEVFVCIDNYVTSVQNLILV